jgi:branched-chain amino acid transport system substrate-binding protein
MIASRRGPSRRSFLHLALLAAGLGIAGPLAAAEPIKIGLVTALSGQSAKAGEAITRGLTIAIEEINAKGGVLGGRKFELIRRDDEANPAKGQVAARELLFKEKVAVLFGGLDTPVSLAIVPIMNEQKIPFMGPWAAGTPITRNGANPNFVFRVSAVDEIVDRAMLQYAQKNYGAKNPGIIVVNNPWGESNQKGLLAALQAKGMKPAGLEKFEPNDVDITPQLSRLKEAGADTLLLVGNVGPSAQVVKSLDRMGWKVPIVSHWGPAGGRFSELAGPNAKDVVFVQTYSFFGKQTPSGERVLAWRRDERRQRRIRGRTRRERSARGLPDRERDGDRRRARVRRQARRHLARVRSSDRRSRPASAVGAEGRPVGL